MGLIKKAVAIGGIYYVVKKMHESKQDNQNGHCQQRQQQISDQSPPPQQQQLPMITSREPMTIPRAIGHQSYCNGQCGGQCSFNASEQYGYEAKAPVYDEKTMA